MYKGFRGMEMKERTVHKFSSLYHFTPSHLPWTEHNNESETDRCSYQNSTTQALKSHGPALWYVPQVPNTTWISLIFNQFLKYSSNSIFSVIWLLKNLTSYSPPDALISCSSPKPATISILITRSDMHNFPQWQPLGSGLPPMSSCLWVLLYS